MATKSRVLKLGKNPFGSELLICIIDCVKKNWAQTLRSGFSIRGWIPLGSHKKNMPWEIGLRIYHTKTLRITPKITALINDQIRMICFDGTDSSAPACSFPFSLLSVCIPYARCVTVGGCRIQIVTTVGHLGQYSVV